MRSPCRDEHHSEREKERLHMKARGMAIVLALVLAVAATGAVFLYVKGVKADARSAATDLVEVVVPKQEIPAGTRLDDVISAGGFTVQRIPPDAVVEGAATDLSQLQHRTTSSFILGGEQITSARLQGSTERTGGVLGIPRGHEALTIQLDPQRVPGQVLQPGDRISVYATFTDVTLIRGPSLVDYVDGKGFAAAPVEGPAKEQKVGNFTVKIVPDVEVLSVSGQEEETATVTSPTGGIMVTLALLPEDAQRLVYAQEKGTVWLGLLPPGEKGIPQLPVNALSAFEAAIGALGGEQE
jgi:pilus assembly protein CpaB